MEQTEQRVQMVADGWFKHDGRDIAPHDEFECTEAEAQDYESKSLGGLAHRKADAEPQDALESEVSAPTKRKYTRRATAE